MDLRLVRNPHIGNAAANMLAVVGAATAMAIAILIILGLALNTGSASATAISAPQSSGSSLSGSVSRGIKPNTRAVPSCDLSWKVVPSANVETDTNQLVSVSAFSTNDVWAVGQIGTRQATLTEHWDGSSWAIYPSPNAGTSQNYLTDVAAVGTDNAWAVGLSWPDGQFPQSFMLHWDGAVWTQVVVPSPGTQDNSLYAIEVVSATDIWAGGAYMNDSGGSRAFMLHWDGTTWSLVAVPGQSGQTDWDRIESIKALSANDIWAAGYYREVGGLDSTLVLHWDGTAWSRIPSPNPGPHRNFFYGIAPISASDVWAFGNYDDDLGDSYFTLIMHWDGTAWTQFASPSPGNLGNKLGEAVAFSASDIWTAGSYYNSNGTGGGVVLHWDGAAWTQDTTASLPGFLTGIDGLSPTDIWAVGGASGRTQVEHYSTDCPIPTPTYAPTQTSTPTGTATQTPTSTPIGTSTQTQTPTSTPTMPAGTATQAPTSTPTGMSTQTPTSTSTAPIGTPTPVPPGCPGERFTDVCPGDYFFEPVISLNDAGIVSGYNSTPPCLTPGDIPCYLPYNNVTRGQSAKIVALSGGFTEPVNGQLFEDIPPGSTFYDYVQRLANRGIVAGYPCGGVGEPCGANNFPYFRQNNSVTRGQLSKMTSEAFNYNDAVSGQSFEDVAVGSTFYPYIQRLAVRGLINGYPCGGTGEPCGPNNLPYFRPGNPVTRGQTAKILYLARSLVTPTPTSTTTSMPDR